MITATVVVLMAFAVVVCGEQSALATVRVSTGKGCQLVRLEHVEMAIDSSPAPPLFDIGGEERIIIKEYNQETDSIPVRVHSTDDPRFVHIAAPENDSDPHGKGRYRTKSAIFEVVVARYSSHISITADGNVTTISIPANPFTERKRQFTTLQASIKHSTMQQAGPVETQNNLVFLSSGYQASDEDRFNSDTTAALEFMKLPETASEGYKFSVPFARYASILNVFRVFQPSEDAGASVPRTGTNVNNNLDCSYGNPESGEVERMLSCNMEKVSDLASTAPCGAIGKKNVVVVSLVNHDIYGGAGMYHERRDGTTFRQASFFNGYLVPNPSDKQKANFASLFFHEVGHAYANLFDEYSFDTSSRGEQRTLPNCAYSKTNIPWQGWIDLRSSDPYKVVSQEPVPVCGYTDYYKPSQTADGCIMDKLSASRVCPVCRQAGVLAFYETGFEITNPRCPQQGEVILLEPGKHVWLYTNKRLTKLGNFNIVWSYNGNQLDVPVAVAPTSMKVRACNDPCTGGGKNSEHLNLREGYHIFTLTVQDVTDWVLDADKTPQMTVTTTFTVRVIKTSTLSSFTNSSIRDCHTGEEQKLFELGVDGASHTSYCDDSNNLTCTIDYKSSTYQQTADLDGVADDIEGFVFGVVGACVGGLLLLFLVIWCCLARDNARRAKCIFKEQRPKWLECVRWTMIFSAVLCMAGAATAITLGMLSYSKFGAIGKILVFAALGVAVILFIIAFVGFTGAWYRSKCALTINGVLLGFCLTVSISWLVFSIIFHNTVSDRDSWAQSWLEDLWMYLAENEDAMLCSLEEALECSGYHENCQRIQSLKHCPENCETTHFQSWAVTPCEEVMKGYFEDNFSIIIIISAAVVVLMIIACILNFLLRRSVGRYKKKVRADRVAKGAGPGGRGSGNILQIIASLTWPERRALKDEFSRLDKDGDGTLDMKEFRFFIQTALLYKASKKEVQEVFDRTDRNGNGRISLEEFVDLLGLQADHNQPLDLSNPSMGGYRNMQAAPPQGGYPFHGQQPAQQFHTHHYYGGMPTQNNSPMVARGFSPEPTKEFSAASFNDPKPQLYDPDTVYDHKRSPSAAPHHPPPVQGRSMAGSAPRGDDWQLVDSPNGKSYYWNRATGETSFENPWSDPTENPPSSSPSPSPSPSPVPVTREKSKKRVPKKSLRNPFPFEDDDASVNAWLMGEQAVDKKSDKKKTSGDRELDDDASINAWLQDNLKSEKKSKFSRDDIPPASFFSEHEESRPLTTKVRKPNRNPLRPSAPVVSDDGFFSPASYVDLLTKISKGGPAGNLPPSQLYERLNESISSPQDRLEHTTAFEQLLDSGNEADAVTFADEVIGRAPEVVLGPLLERATVHPYPTVDFVRKHYAVAIHTLIHDGPEGLAAFIRDVS
eukprot:TRINITY_DN12880_c0_g1_i3.p1 TRINITY_DN12880_c0_g1~~TRINITY_DN12880_c0_g1_i3.p1  ORF type:complete len:1395 (+),score=214.47 TRINITY_DN12880_c0_g1_i3:1956-6140(+)